MITQICYVVLTLTSGGNPTLINFNQVLAIRQYEDSGNTQISFIPDSPSSPVYVNEAVEEILEKALKCNKGRSDFNFVFVGQ